jgi:hypothetical protein
MSEPLTPEEEADLRNWVRYHPPSNAQWFARLLATLDAARVPSDGLREAPKELAAIAEAAHRDYDRRHGEAPRPWIDAALAASEAPVGLDVEAVHIAAIVAYNVADGDDDLFVKEYEAQVARLGQEGGTE